MRQIQLIRPLGDGAMGTVHLAELTDVGGFRKQVAVKLLNDQMQGSNEVAARLRDEARVLGLLQHRAIVGVHGLAELPQGWAVLMEYVPGTDLRQLLLERGRLPPRAAAELAAEVASALHAAYALPAADGPPLNLLHRDIKPANIRVTPQGDVKVLDFGVARADFSSREAQSLDITFGSPAYMAPERFAFHDSHAGDVYALCATLFEALTGKQFGPTKATSAQHQDLLRRRMGDAADLGLPPAMLQLLRRGLDDDGDQRPSAREMEKELRGLLGLLPGASLRDWMSGSVETPSPLAPTSMESFQVPATEWVRLPATPSTPPPKEAPSPPAAARPAPPPTAPPAPPPELRPFAIVTAGAAAAPASHPGLDTRAHRRRSLEMSAVILGVVAVLTLTGLGLAVTLKDPPAEEAAPTAPTPPTTALADLEDSGEAEEEAATDAGAAPPERPSTHPRVKVAPPKSEPAPAPKAAPPASAPQPSPAPEAAPANPPAYLRVSGDGSLTVGVALHAELSRKERTLEVTSGERTLAVRFDDGKTWSKNASFKPHAIYTLECSDRNAVCTLR